MRHRERLKRAWRSRILDCFALLAMTLVGFSAFAAESVTLEHSTARLISASTTYQPGKPLNVGVHVLLEEGWHTYTLDPGDAGIPTTVAWTLPPGFGASALGYPPHETFDESGLTTYGYKDEVVFPTTITVPESASDTLMLSAKAEYLVCKEICIPQIAELTLTLAPGEFTPSDDVDLLERYSKATNTTNTPPIPNPESPIPPPTATSGLGLPLALAFALLGGLILNLMPCVFPVLSLKALSIAKSTEKERAHVRKEALAYTLGILTCFWVIVSILIVIGQGFGWGFQFQSPGFVGVMALLLFIVGLNLSGMFELPVLLGST